MATSNVFKVWQFLKNDSRWITMDDAANARLDALPVGGKETHESGFTIRTTRDTCRTYLHDGNLHDMRRVLFNEHNRRVLFEYNTLPSGWGCVQNVELTESILALQPSQSVTHKSGTWTHQITKIDATHAVHENSQTKVKRQLRLVEATAVDLNCASRPNHIRKTHIAQSKLHVGDVHDVALRAADMRDDDRTIYAQFLKTLSRHPGKFHVFSIQKIKDNVSKRSVYDAVLAVKREELKDENVSCIERVLFHGTSFGNVANIVNNGFNRDFNRKRNYGKGTYFSSLASVSLKYCTNDCEYDPDKLVMLVCRVITGEFTQGTRSMDGGTIPTKEGRSTQYESCVNDVHNPTIFVVNRDYHAIPTHIINFRRKIKKGARRCSKGPTVSCAASVQCVTGRAKLAEGAYMRLKGLVRVPRFNGQTVKTVCYVERKARWKVKLLHGNQEKKYLGVRTENLDPIVLQ